MLAARPGADEDHLEQQAVTDPQESVQTDLERLSAWPGLPERARASGHIYDVESGVITTVSPATEPTSPSELPTQIDS